MSKLGCATPLAEPSRSRRSALVSLPNNSGWKRTEAILTLFVLQYFSYLSCTCGSVHNPPARENRAQTSKLPGQPKVSFSQKESDKLRKSCSYNLLRNAAFIFLLDHFSMFFIQIQVIVVNRSIDYIILKKVTQHFQILMLIYCMSVVQRLCC